MELERMDSIKTKLIEYKEGVGKFTEKMPEFTKTYTSFTEACFSEGALSKKMKQLMALGISIHAQDEYCIIYHTKGCLDQGCTEDEILNAICVAAAFGGGPSMSQGVTLVQACIDELNQ
ncbi:carboxymuconolactone decarboxylase family protein [Virgibacillus sp. AGTR]|uniref:carboxymuconolactone decarboxylase family protein n=1 Tax=Virgibacillus sp. AGTR TaxID=2812055 RepID=UPI0019648A56|nr:carboxymuconolactone decarboxylase family protein [Virgibacillus sp. AGTR]MCC2252038.1 carboxymuconolactone decarboxylase family protein [Virgibacillus sp. AGTR]QRZ20017.1 carboxymuconolactone decarboxylase family protein [Virgibacillus sp. AGTR]